MNERAKQAEQWTTSTTTTITASPVGRSDRRTNGRTDWWRTVGGPSRAELTNYRTQAGEFLSLVGASSTGHKRDIDSELSH